MANSYLPMNKHMYDYYVPAHSSITTPIYIRSGAVIIMHGTWNLRIVCLLFGNADTNTVAVQELGRNGNPSVSFSSNNDGYLIIENTADYGCPGDIIYFPNL